MPCSVVLIPLSSGPGLLQCPRARPHDWTACPFAHPVRGGRRVSGRRSPAVLGPACQPAALLLLYLTAQPLSAAGGEGEAAGPPALPLQRHSLPGFPQGTTGCMCAARTAAERVGQQLLWVPWTSRLSLQQPAVLPGCWSAAAVTPAAGGCLNRAAAAGVEAGHTCMPG